MYKCLKCLIFNLKNSFKDLELFAVDIHSGHTNVRQQLIQNYQYISAVLRKHTALRGHHCTSQGAAVNHCSNEMYRKYYLNFSVSVHISSSAVQPTGSSVDWQTADRSCGLVCLMAMWTGSSERVTV